MSVPIALLTDFGTQDGYVGIMKGVIASTHPDAPVIDISHAVCPQDRLAARFILLNAVPYFPTNTIYTVVVDPGVGTRRRAIAVQFSRGYLIGPDNGIFSGTLDTFPAIAAVTLNKPQYWRTPQPSTTFHGRDIFAPAAAYLSAGLPLAELGQAIELHTLTNLNLPKPTIEPYRITGQIQYIDHFGNLITTIPGTAIAPRDWHINLNGTPIALQTTYGEVALGKAVAIVGSHNWVEIAVNQGSAQAYYKLKIGDPIQLIANSPHTS